MVRPSNINELIQYLHKNPRVRYTNIVLGIYDQHRVFNGLTMDGRGIKWNVFNLKWAFECFAVTPINCNIDKGTITFDEDSFAFTAFGVTSRFYYED